MVFDHLDYAEKYYSLSEGIKEALSFLKTFDVSTYEKGKKIIIDGDQIFAVFPEYQTIPEKQAKMEAHRKYIDVMYLCEGKEKIGYLPTAEMKSAGPYDEKIEALLSKEGEKMNKIDFLPGYFAIWFPEDGHAPGICFEGEESELCRKVVVKVAV